MTCKSVDEAFEAGLRDSADDPPLTAEQVTRIALLLAPYRTAAEQAA